MVDSTLYLYTSLTAGSSHIITATSRLETILKANKIPFRAIDCATDEKARQLWSRRGKGKKIPGLVKYGQIIGDLEQVEEWNEFGELKEQVNSVSDIFGDTPMTDTPMAPPVNTLPPNPINPIVEKPKSPSISRSSSETRHISISEPKDSREKENPAASMRRDDSPLALAMRHAGAEAAAKAGSKKTAISASPSRPSITETPAEATHVGNRASETAALDIPDTTITDAKTPEKLSAEGSIRRTSADRSAEQGGRTSPDSDRSNEEQVLDMRRRSSIVRSTSRLAEETTMDDLDELPSNQGQQASGAKLHRGSSVTEVPKEVADQVEKENLIKEEDEEDEEEEEKDLKKQEKPAKKISATDAEEAKVLKGSKPQDAKAADLDEAGVSVGD